ncbi:cell wall protein [Fusarium pseudoanthophilum]|uniref:Cell wall protein n=1 Tax=Fusarium pseudoanthophilum TaxID=48495 RepID=A0A8H5KI44_9HYPO|nr:cell wall protein [Fusarium pseudoanthophilum]
MRSIIVTTIFAGYAAASSLSKQPKPIRRTSAFQIVYNGTEKLKAANNTLYIGSPEQDACCNQFNAEDAATFYLQDEELFLYSPGNPKQQVIVNSTKAATECQNSVGYAIGSREKLDKTLSEGWQIDDDDNITFDGLNLMFLLEETQTNKGGNNSSHINPALRLQDMTSDSSKVYSAQYLNTPLFFMFKKGTEMKGSILRG